MAIKFSTGLKNAILATGSLKSQFDDGYIAVYSGAVPADADAALGAAVLLNTYSDNGQAPGAGMGLDLDASAASGAISKPVAQVWKGTSVAGGTASFFRFYKTGDSGNSSTTDLRIQGTVGGAGADMFVQSTTFANTTEYTIDYFSVAVPNL